MCRGRVRVKGVGLVGKGMVSGKGEGLVGRG